MSKEKLFPLMLPANYHGPVKRYIPPTEKYLEKSGQKVQCDQPAKKISKWQRKIKDNDIVKQRREYLVHPAKISQDNPDWLKSTSHYFQRAQFNPYRRETLAERKQFDVFGGRKTDLQARRSQSTAAFARQNRITKEITPKIGVDYSKPISLHKSGLHREIPNKIGFTQNRSTMIKQPQLKVGSLYQHNFVDTYSVN